MRVPELGGSSDKPTAADPYASTTNPEQQDGIYGDGSGLAAKWQVMQDYRVEPVSFEEWLLARLDLQSSRYCLDVGAGSGRFAIPLARRLSPQGGRVVAIDVASRVMSKIEQARRTESVALDTIICDVAALPADLVGFDLIIAAHMLYHVDNKHTVLRDLGSRLARRGMLVATCNSESGMPEFFQLHIDAMNDCGLGVNEGPPANDFTIENGAEYLERVFEQVRLETYDGGFTAPNVEPVFRYYSGTQLYRAVIFDVHMPEDARAALGAAFVRRAQQKLEHDGGTLHVSKPVGAFFCTSPKN